MIKLFKDLTAENKKKFLANGVSITEKIDLTFFKIEISEYGIYPLKTPEFTAISDIDCLCNSIYKDISEFTQNVFYKAYKQILGTIGTCVVYIFYSPIQKSKSITYNNLLDKTFIISKVELPNAKTNYIDERNLMQTLMDIINEYNRDIYNILFNFDIFKIFDENETDNIIKLSTADKKYDTDVIQYILDCVKDEYNPVSKNASDEIEGLIIKSGKNQYQLLNKQPGSIPDYNASEKLIYRNYILSNLASMLTNDYIKKIESNTGSYIDKVCNLFLDYMDYTDAFSKYQFESDDLQPPGLDYKGDMDLNMLTSETVKTICMMSEIRKNILKLFLHTFRNPISKNKFRDLPDEHKQKLNDLIIAIKYKNYNEIARQQKIPVN